MVVQHNLTAMNSNRMLGVTTGSQAKSTEKLSSGYKINRAADDAAGLSISEKMRKQIRGLSQASLNAQDGISAVQTAEGALNEVQDMLQRMNELAVKAANGTMSENDRNYIQDEIDQLVTEIDRVAETTKFNETYLLKGDKGAAQAKDYQYKNTTEAALVTNTLYTAKAGGGYDTVDDADELKAALEAGKELIKTQASDGTPATAANATKTIAFADQLNSTVKTADPADIAWANGGAGTKTLTLTGAASGKFSIAGIEFDYNKASDVAAKKDEIIAASKGTITNVAVAGDVVTVTGADNTKVAKVDIFDANGTKKYSANDTIEDADFTTIGTADQKTFYTDAPDKEVKAVAGTDYTEAEKAQLYDKDGNAISANGIQFYYEDGAYAGGLYTDKDGANEVAAADIATYVDETKTKTGALTLKLHVGADATDNNQISVDLEAMSAAGIGVKDLKVNGKDDTNARDAIETIKAALQQVSQQRSALGAVQNRLEHTIANLDNVVENTTAAESQIRDTDMATEMVKYSNNNILAQAGTSMLAQANQSNQNILSLLG